MKRWSRTKIRYKWPLSDVHITSLIPRGCRNTNLLGHARIRWSAAISRTSTFDCPFANLTTFKAARVPWCLWRTRDTEPNPPEPMNPWGSLFFLLCMKWTRSRPQGSSERGLGELGGGKESDARCSFEAISEFTGDLKGEDSRCLREGFGRAFLLAKKVGLSPGFGRMRMGRPKWRLSKWVTPDLMAIVLILIPKLQSGTEWKVK